MKRPNRHIVEQSSPNLRSFENFDVQSHRMEVLQIAVELGAVTHMLAAVHEIDDDTMIKLRAMCIDEVKRINGVINFEKAVRYQRLD